MKKLSCLFVLALALTSCQKPRSVAEGCDQADADPRACGNVSPSRPDDKKKDAAVSTSNPDPGDGKPATGAGCDPGFHKCNGACKDSTQISNCGLACDPCPEIQGGRATCDGLRCGVECPAGQKPCDDKCVPSDTACGGCAPGKNPCNGICVAVTEKTACGTSCTVCPTSPNGTTECDGDCKLLCNAGYHLCGDQCLPDDSPESCGRACSPCNKPEGGDATCNSGACRPTCPAGTALCPGTGKCQPMDQPCDRQCPAGKHVCNDLCVPDTDVNSCGTSCVPCVAPANGEPVCGETKTCAFKCRTGFHACGDGCKPDNSAGSCGTSCQPCQAPANGTATCTAGACGIQCNEGFHKCGDQCKANNDATACGASCTACPANGGQATCKNGQCGVDCQGGQNCNGKCIGASEPCGNSCPGGLRKCGDQCVMGNCCSNGDCQNGFACANNQCSNSQCAQQGQINCGGKCIACSDAANGKSGCVNGQCALTGCNNGYFQCEGRCVQNGQRCGNSCGEGFKTCGAGCIASNQCCTNGSQGCPGPTCSGDNATTYSCQSGNCQASSKGCGGAGCSGTACAAKRQNGQTCSAGGQCESGTCVDNQKCCAQGQNLCNGNCNSGACCGNGRTESPETCDGNCPSAGSCVSSGCTVRQFTGTASACSAKCQTSNQTQCRSNDSCCPSGCNPGNDNDCKCPAGEVFQDGACRPDCGGADGKFCCNGGDCKRPNELRCSDRIKPGDNTFRCEACGNKEFDRCCGTYCDAPFMCKGATCQRPNSGAACTSNDQCDSKKCNLNSGCSCDDDKFPGPGKTSVICNANGKFCTNQFGGAAGMVATGTCVCTSGTCS